MHATDYFLPAEPYNLFKFEELRHVEESSPQYTRRFRWSERHLQCIWFDEKLRPGKLVLASGETLTVLDPGRWNLEAGPDFLDAELRVDPGARIIRGDVEAHVYPSDWDSHGHAKNPSYANVVLHVSWFGTPQAKTLPADTFRLSLAKPMQACPWISIDDIDIKAYPHNTLPKSPRPCRELLFNNPDYTEKLLLSAGYHRIQNKTLSITRRLEDTADREQIFYEEIMAALGYKQNKFAFRALASKVPVSAYTESRDYNLALLLGTARLLPDPDTVEEEESSVTVRKLWDIWWKSGRVAAEEIAWTMHGIRPNNHPTRRIAAAAALFTGENTLLRRIDALGGMPGKEWIRGIYAIVRESTEWPFWNSRLLFGSPANGEKHFALIGQKRVSAILTNVIVPFYAAERGMPPDTFSHLPPEDISSPMKTAAWYLLGRDHNPALYAGNNILQQGLLQIFLDFCLQAKAGCRGCRLLKKIEKDLKGFSCSTSS